MVKCTHIKTFDISKTHLHIVIDTGSVHGRFQIKGGEVDDVMVPWLQLLVAKAVRAVRVFRVAVGEVRRLQRSFVVVNDPLTHWKRCQDVRPMFTFQIGANSSILSEYIQHWHQLVITIVGQRAGIHLFQLSP